MKSRLAALLCVAMIVAPAFAQNEKPSAKSPLIARAGDTGFIVVKANSFESLSPKQQSLAYWLTQASIAIDPIIYDQLSAYALREKRLLEEIVAHPNGIDPHKMAQITEFTELFWANRGNHNLQTSRKFLPAFTEDELKAAALTARKQGAFTSRYADLPPITTATQLEKELSGLRASLFDANFEPMITAKSPKPRHGHCASQFQHFLSRPFACGSEKFSRRTSAKFARGKGREGQTPRRNLPCRHAGPLGSSRPLCHLSAEGQRVPKKARAFADPQQAQVIDDLVRYYQTGDPNDWLKFDADWVQDNATVDFSNGFVEIYRDARGAKGSMQGFVTITDQPVTETMLKLANNANYFEQKAPWDAKYKKTSFKPPVVKAVETLIETGDFEVNTIGDNLPNENQIHEKYGTKNFLFTGSSRALDAASGDAILNEFASSPEEIARDKKYGDKAGELMTALHEVIGHGSGKLSPRLMHGAEPELKEYFSTLEEGRADLMALWNVWDPKLKELGLVTGQDQDEIAKAMYDSAARVALTQLRRIPTGDTLEEDHDRDRQLIAHYIMDKTGGIEHFQRDGKAYVRVKDYAKMREGVGMLLAELMRIKAEGDYAAIKALVDKYGSHFDPALRDQVRARFEKLGLPSYWAGINSRLTAQFTKTGAIEKVEISYPTDPASQYLNYGAMYDKGLVATRPEPH